MRKLTEDYVGCCQACFGEFKVGSDKRMVLHGYKRPGTGYTHGQCSGTDHLPFEYDTSLTQLIIKQHRQDVADWQERVTHLKTGVINKLERTWSTYDYASRKSIDHSEMVGPDSEYWNWLLKVAISDAEGWVRFITQMADWKQARVDAWTPGQKIVGIDTPPTGKIRGMREAYDPDVAAEEERKAAEKAARDAKPGKLKLTLFWDSSVRYGDMSAEEKNEIKAWAKATFPVGKQRVVETYASDAPIEVRRADHKAGKLEGYRLIVTVNIDWTYVDQIADVLPGSTRVDETKKKVEFWQDVTGQRPWKK